MVRKQILTKIRGRVYNSINSTNGWSDRQAEINYLPNTKEGNLQDGIFTVKGLYNLG